jgi:pilus assembly protein FimV
MAAAPASAPVAEAPTAASAPMVAAAPPAVAPKPPAPKPAPVTTPAVEPPGFLSSLMEDNSLAVVLGGGLIALLAGFGIYRYSRRSKRDSGETSFLESRLQPDSFFGASGGQRIDTRDAGGASSSMSYSLSQLDAIGDVDPVAEADVYLAYGRDLQAEEILKEAMRANPDRMAIRTKLLEVYAKRRDIKGFELLATQVYTLTRGEGDDWAKAQEMGQKIDPENRLYQPGGAPALAESSSGQVVEPLGATTMPQSVLPSPSQYGDSVRDAATLAAAGAGVDLDLDFGGAPASGPGSLEATQAFPAPTLPSAGVDLDLPSVPPAPVSSPAPLRPASAPVEFDLSGISLDLDVPVTAPGVLPPAKPDSGFSDLGLPDMGGDVDPFARKLELAEEFRQIGDMEGARDLLQEVVSKAGGTLKAKAQGMLDEIS